MRKKLLPCETAGHQPPPFALSAGHLGYSCIPEVRKDSGAALVACKHTLRTRPPITRLDLL